MSDADARIVDLERALREAGESMGVLRSMILEECVIHDPRRDVWYCVLCDAEAALREGVEHGSLCPTEMLMKDAGLARGLAGDGGDEPHVEALVRRGWRRAVVLSERHLDRQLGVGTVTYPFDLLLRGHGRDDEG